MTSSSATEQAAPTTPALPRPNSLGAWILASRPKTLVAGWAPVLVGTSIAFAADSMRLGLALGALIVAIAIQVGTNFVNDAADHARGADTSDRLGPPRAVALGLLDGERVMRAGSACFGLAGLVGLWLASVAGWWLLLPGAIALAAGVLYTAGPRPLAYLGLGEVFVFFFFGMFATVGTTYVQTFGLPYMGLGDPPFLSGIAGVSLGLLATVILEVNNLRDAPTDVLVGKATLAVRLGESRVRKLIVGFLFATYLFVFPQAMPSSEPDFFVLLPSLLLPLLSIPVAIGIGKAVAAGTSGGALNPVLGRVAKLEGLFAALTAAGYILLPVVSR